MKAAREFSFIFLAGVVLFSVCPVKGSNSLLKNINTCKVSISVEGVSLLEYKDLWNRLEKDVVNRLKEGGLQAVSWRKNPGKSGYGVSEYKVSISKHQAELPERTIYQIETAVTVDIVADAKTKRHIRIQGWSRGGTTQTKQVHNMPSAVSGLIFEHTDDFIKDCKRLNTSVKPAEPNQPEQKNQKQVNSEENVNYFMASKFSKVFHKPGCMWAERIKEENIVKYKTRQQALDDGKRPCKRCKP